MAYDQDDKHGADQFKLVKRKLPNDLIDLDEDTYVQKPRRVQNCPYCDAFFRVHSNMTAHLDREHDSELMKRAAGGES